MLAELEKRTEEKQHGVTALTPTEWRDYIASKSGTYLVIGGRPDSPEHVTYPLSRWDAQRIFDAVVDECEFAAQPGYRVRIVARDR